MHFCSVVVFIVSCGIDVFFLYLNYSILSKEIEGEVLEYVLFWGMALYLFIAVVVSAKVYWVFKY
jgi:uncharacterized membrane protein